MASSPEEWLSIQTWNEDYGMFQHSIIPRHRIPRTVKKKRGCLKTQRDCQLIDDTIGYQYSLKTFETPVSRLSFSLLQVPPYMARILLPRMREWFVSYT